MRKKLNVILNRIHRFIFGLYRNSVRNPKLVLGTSGLIFGSSLLLMGSLRFELALDDFMGTDLPSAGALRESKKFFQDSEALVGLFEPARAELFSEHEMCALWGAIDKTYFYNSNFIAAVISPFHIKIPEVDSKDRLLYKNFLPIQCPGKDQKMSFLNPEFSHWKGVLSDPLGREGMASFALHPQEKKSLSLHMKDHEFYRVKSSLETYSQDISLKTHWIGSRVFEFYMLEGFLKVPLLNTVFLLSIFLLLRLYFGKWSSGLFFIGPAIFAGNITYGLMSFFGDPIDLLSSTIFLMITIAALEDFIFLTSHCMNSSKNAQVSFRKYLLPSFLTSLTTAIGFLSLMVSDLKMIRSFGLWCGIGSLLEWAAFFVVLPALFVIKPHWRLHWVKFSHQSIWNSQIARMSKLHFSKLLLIPSLVIFVAVPFSISKIDFNDTPSSLFPKSHPLRQSLKHIEVARGWNTGFSVVFPNSISQGDAKDLLNRLATNPLVVAIDSPFNVEGLIDKKVPVEFRNLIRNELNSQAAFVRLISDENQSKRAIIYLKEDDVVSIRQITMSIEQDCKTYGCWLAGESITYSEFASKVPRSLSESLVYTLFLVLGVVLAVATARGVTWRNQLALTGSILWGPSIILVGVSVFHVQINFLTSVFATIVVGLSGDNALQFLLSKKTRTGYFSQGIKSEAPASVRVTQLMALSCLLFCLSYFASVRTLGILLFFGLVFSFIGDLWILKLYIKEDRDES